jgi:DNA-binding NarL/FixJ family response regulator
MDASDRPRVHTHLMGGPTAAGPARVRVLVVDDTPDLRAVISLALEIDGRFEVIGEATDGVEGVASAERLQPDVVVLDRSMPRMNGLEALPEIRRVAPSASVVLYTADTDEGVYQAALGLGAVGVMDKTSGVGDLAVHLSDALLQAWGRASLPSVQVGPVPSDAALEWIDNTARVVDVVRRNPGLTETPIPEAVLDTFDAYLATWREVAEAEAEFVWAATAEPSEVHRLIEAWATIDRIPEERLAEHGLAWSAPRGRVFFHAITEAVLEALARHETTLALARRLQPQWG